MFSYKPTALYYTWSFKVFSNPELGGTETSQIKNKSKSQNVSKEKINEHLSWPKTKKHKSRNHFTQKTGTFYTPRPSFHWVKCSRAFSCVFLWFVCLWEINEWDQFWNLVGRCLNFFQSTKKTQLKKTTVFSFSVGFDHSCCIDAICSKHWCSYLTNIRGK